MKSNHFIAKEGRKPILIILVITIILNVIDLEFFATLGFFLIFLLLYMYRNTNRYIFENSVNILSPLDAKVMAIDKDGDKTKLYLQTRLLGDHCVKAPFDCELDSIKRQEGLNLDPATIKGELLNEQASLSFISKEFDKEVKIKIISGLFNPKIELEELESLKQGSKVGFFLDGLIIIQFNGLESLVEVGDRLKSGQSILAKFE